MGCSVGFKYAKNALAAWALPRTPLGELTTLPRHLSRLGRGTPVPMPHPPRRCSQRSICQGLGGLTPHWMKITPTLVTENC